MQPTSTQPAPPIHLARPDAARIEPLLAHLQARHGVDPAAARVVKVPLRICPLGAHIDHQLGPVTGLTIDQSLLLAFAPTTDGRVQIDSLNFNTPVAFSLDQVPPYRPGDWGNYSRGAVLGLQQHYPLSRGLIGVVGGEMPIGGLSSSAAVTIAYLLALETVNGLDVSARENVALVRYTENHYIGLNNGILDQSVILFNEQDQLTLIDCATIEVSNVPPGPALADYELLVIYSGISHGLVGTDYNNRVAECREAARQMLTLAGQPLAEPPLLGHVAPQLFAEAGPRLDTPLRKRAAHFFGEVQRVAEGVAAWQAGDLAAFGRLISASGHSSITNYECGSPPLISLYEILAETPGVYGTRFSGAGFRGSCLALIDPAARESIAEAVQRRYPTAHPQEAAAYSLHICRPGCRAQVLPPGGTV
ncbi:MAG: hypothetical protein KDF65_04075 [Anaerolineae bacterium]|nr:hypothetical protein [Anaerolineae bacterium]